MHETAFPGDSTRPFAEFYILAMFHKVVVCILFAEIDARKSIRRDLGVQWDRLLRLGAMLVRHTIMQGLHILRAETENE